MVEVKEVEEVKEVGEVGEVGRCDTCCRTMGGQTQVWRWETSDVRHQTSDARVAAATVLPDIVIGTEEQ